MSTLIFNVAATPDLVDSSVGEQEVEISWDAIMTAVSDNPVNIELNLHPDSPVFFISTNNQRVKTVVWQQNLKTDFHNYKETVVIRVTLAQAQTQVTKLRMDTRDSGGVMSSGITFLMYQ